MIVSCQGRILAALKAVSVADTLNGVGLLLIGVIVPVTGIGALGNGSVSLGLSIITSDHTY